MEYGQNFTIFALKMMVKSGLEKVFLKLLHAEAIFFYFILLYRKEASSTKNTNSVTKMTFLSHGGISKKCFVGYADMIYET